MQYYLFGLKDIRGYKSKFIFSLIFSIPYSHSSQTNTAFVSIYIPPFLFLPFSFPLFSFFHSHFVNQMHHNCYFFITIFTTNVLKFSNIFIVELILTIFHIRNVSLCFWWRTHFSKAKFNTPHFASWITNSTNHPNTCQM